MKYHYTITLLLLLCMIQVSAQHDFDGRVLKLGYRMGRTGFSPGYIPYTYDYTTQTRTLGSPGKERIIVNNWDIKLERYSENVFYQGDLSGILYYFCEYTYWLATKKSNIGRAEKLKHKDFTQFGSDFNLIDLKLAFGKNPYYFGLDLGYAYFGTSTALIGYGGARSTDNAYLANLGHGFYGFNANYFLKTDFGVTHFQLTFDWLRAGPDGKGTAIGIEAITYLGDKSLFFVAPYFKHRTFGNARFGESGYGQDPIRLKLNSTALGLRFGFNIGER